MTENWNRWLNKEVVVETTNSKYFGKIVEVTDSGDGLIWIGLYRRDNGKFVLFLTKEIKKIEELEK